MKETSRTPKWARPPIGCRCSICGQSVHGWSQFGPGDDYEAVKPKGGRPTVSLHTACVEKERSER